MKVLLDTDLASAFAKVGRMELLVRLFTGSDLGITFEVYKELLVPLRYGYDFPEAIFAVCETIYPNPEEMATVQRRLVDVRALGRGELETSTICQAQGWFYAAIDQKAIAYARSWDHSLPFGVILRLLWMWQILSQKEIRALIQNCGRRTSW